MDAALAAPHPYRMLQVQHLVVDNVLHGATGNTQIIENAAHDDRIVGWIIVSQAVAGVLAAPGHRRAGQKSIKKMGIQFLEDDVEIVSAALRRSDALPSAHLPHPMGFARHVLTRNVAPVTGRVVAVNRLAVHFCEKDVCNCSQHIVWRAFQQIGDAHQELAFAHADGVVNVGEGKEFRPQLRDRRPRPKLAVAVFKKLGKFAVHERNIRSLA